MTEIIAIAAVCTVIFLIVSVYHNQRKTRTLTKKLVNAACPEKPSPVNFSSLAGLPEPVQRYFRTVLDDGQLFINLARLQQTGELRAEPKSKKWLPFTATNIISQRPVGFVWDAKINSSAFFHLRVSDSFLQGVGAGQVSLMSAIASDENNPALNAGALYRYLAESVWHPTALLPQSGVKWKAVDGQRAIACITQYGLSVALEFRFNNAGEITGIYSEERYGRFDGKYVKFPWQGYFSNYQEIDGIKIPTEAEVGWHLPQGWWLFWKGRIVSAEFDCRL